MGGEGGERVAASLSPPAVRAGSMPRHAPLQRAYHAIGKVRRHRVFHLEIGVSGGDLEDLFEVHSRMLSDDLRCYVADVETLDAEISFLNDLGRVDQVLMPCLSSNGAKRRRVVKGRAMQGSTPNKRSPSCGLHGGKECARRLSDAAPAQRFLIFSCCGISNGHVTRRSLESRLKQRQPAPPPCRV